jgi:formate hydrogenlyase subunit 3/multisubunit Na+/H+ antiporter MnhD subunit
LLLIYDGWRCFIIFWDISYGIFNYVLIGGFLAMFQRNVKRILAYSTMSSDRIYISWNRFNWDIKRA